MKNNCLLTILFMFSMILFSSCFSKPSDKSEEKAECGNNVAEQGELCDGTDLSKKTCTKLGLGKGTLSCLSDCSNFDTASCGASETCGDDKVNGTDVCDGKDLDGKSCADFNYTGGTLACLSNCSDFDLSNCTGSIGCGNDKIDGTDVCDGKDLGGKTCKELGFGEGALACKTDCSGYDTSDCSPAETCGDDKVNGTDVCDGNDLDGKSCTDFNYSDGTLACLANCSDFDLSKCTGKIECGNDKIDGTDVCDGKDLGGKTCKELGFGEGSLACKTDCSGYDTSGCSPAETCGDDKVNGADVCDGKDLDGKSCTDFNYSGGTLACLSNCSDFDLSKCTGKIKCGNDKVDGTDVCDGKDLDGKTCTNFNYSGGTLACDSDCSKFDLSGCTGKIECGNNKIDGTDACDGTDLNGKSCEDFGFYSGTLACLNNCSDYDKSGCEECPVACGARECGLDPVCGESCGTCGNYEICNESYICEKTCDLEPIKADTVLNVNMKTAICRGEVTLNGQQMPDNSDTYYRGAVKFINMETGQSLDGWVGLEGKGGQYEVELVKGLYKVQFVPYNVEGNDLPKIDIQLKESLEITGSEDTVVNNFNINTSKVSGAVTINGLQMKDISDDHYSRGIMKVIRLDTGDTLTYTLPPKGAATYSFDLYEGEYKVMLMPEVYRKNPIPHYNIALDASYKLAAGTVTKNFNVNTVEISGEMKINGTQMPDSTYADFSRGELHLIQKECDPSVATTSKKCELSLPLGATGKATYSTTVYEGNYKVLILPTKDSLMKKNVIPPMTAVVGDDIVIDSSSAGIKNFNIDTVTVSGEVTINETAMEDNDSVSRGKIRFVNKDTQDYLSRSFSESGPARYERTLYKAHYKVLLLPNEHEGNDITKLDVVLDDDFHMNSSSSTLSKSFNINEYTFGGSIKINGEKMKDNTHSSGERRGVIHFYNLSTGDHREDIIWANGEEKFFTFLYAGDYKVVIIPNKHLQNVMPNMDLTIEKRITINSSTHKDYDLHTAQVSGEIKYNGETMPELPSASVKRCDIQFVSKNSEENTISQMIMGTGDAKYNINLWTGSYDVFIDPGDDLVQDKIVRTKAKVIKGCQ